MDGKARLAAIGVVVFGLIALLQWQPLSAVADVARASRQGRHTHEVVDSITVVWMSDVHWNPSYTKVLGPRCMCFNYGPYLCSQQQESAMPWPFDGAACEASSNGNPWGQFGCDSPWDLVTDILANAHDTHPEADAVLLTGDSVAHESCQLPVTDPVSEAGVRIVQALSAKVASVFDARATRHIHHAPDIFSAVLGNDDFVPDYYLPNVTDGRLGPPLPYLEALAEGLLPPLTAEQRFMFVRAGPLRYALHADLCVLALNTVVYSPSHVGGSGAPARPQLLDPLAQFAWLEAQLADVRSSRGRAIIVGHIPPTIDQFSFTLEWTDRYARRYVEIVARFAEVVSAQLFGHTHQNMLRAFPRTEGGRADGPPLLVTAAVSPIYGNNPTWRSLDFGRASGLLRDFKVFYANLSAASASRRPRWEPLFSAGVRYAPYDVLSSEGIRALACALMRNDALYDKYLFDRVSGADGWSEPHASARLGLARRHGRAEPEGASAGADGAKLYRLRLACSLAHGFSQADFDACVADGGPRDESAAGRVEHTATREAGGQASQRRARAVGVKVALRLRAEARSRV